MFLDYFWLCSKQQCSGVDQNGYIGVFTQLIVIIIFLSILKFLVYISNVIEKKLKLSDSIFSIFIMDATSRESSDECFRRSALRSEYRNYLRKSYELLRISPMNSEMLPSAHYVLSISFLPRSLIQFEYFYCDS